MLELPNPNSRQYADLFRGNPKLRAAVVTINLLVRDQNVRIALAGGSVRSQHVSLNEGSGSAMLYTEGDTLKLRITHTNEELLRYIKQIYCSCLLLDRESLGQLDYYVIGI